MYAAALPVALAYYFIWNPPADFSSSSLFLYLLISAITTRILISCYEIPSASLGPELAKDYDQRTSLLTYRYFFGWWGGLTVSVLAYAVLLHPTEKYPVGLLNPGGYQNYGLMSAIIMFSAIMISAIGTHNQIPYLQSLSPDHRQTTAQKFRQVTDAFKNPSFLAILAGALFIYMASGFHTSLSTYFYVYFWRLTPGQISQISAVGFIAAILALALSRAIGQALGKKPACMVSAALLAALVPLPVLFRLMDLFPGNDSVWLLPFLLVHVTIVITLAIIIFVFFSAMIADIVEDQELKTGRRTEGIFFAANAFVQKSVTGIGLFASSLALRWVDFPSQAKPDTIPPEILHHLAMIYIPVSSGLFCVGIFFLSFYGITRAHHFANLAALDKRRQV